VVEAWLATPFEGGRHERRVTEIEDLAAQSDA
jgi:ribose 5-phosphate isomerase RpiB